MLSVLFCCSKLKATPAPELITDNCSVVYTSVFKVVVSPKIIKLLSIVNEPPIFKS